MGFFNQLGAAFGLSKGDVAQQDPTQYSDLYQNALSQMQGVGNGTAQNRSGIQAGVNDQLSQLANNSAGLKSEFADDQGRSNAANQQNQARAAGGTGSLANQQRNAANNYDAEARGTASGYNQLYQTATNNLNSLTGIDNSFYNQDANTAKGIASTYQNELTQRRGIQSQNTATQEQANQNQQKNAGGLLGGILGSIF